MRSLPCCFPFLLALSACNSEPEPGKPGYVDCEAFDLGPDCEVVDICCETLEDYEIECAYVTQADQRFECLSEIDCTGAAQDLTCAVCDFGTNDAYSGCP